MRICLLLLPLLYQLGTAMELHQSDICKPKISRQELYDLSLRGAMKGLLRQIELHNGQKAVTLDKMVEITNLFSEYVLHGTSINFILRIIHIQCRLNKPVHKNGTAEPEEEAFLCVLEAEAEKCYKYKDRMEGEITVEEAKSDAVAEAPKGAAETPKGAAETPKGAAEAPKGAAEAPKGAAEAPKGAAEPSKEGEEPSKAGAEPSKEGGEASKTGAETAKEGANEGQAAAAPPGEGEAKPAAAA